MKGWLLALGVLLAGCGETSRLSQETLPDLPTIKFEAFQSTIRSEVQEAYDAAKAKPRDAAVVGELAIVLHAHQQNAGAEACYDRCRILEPDRLESANPRLLRLAPTVLLTGVDDLERACAEARTQARGGLVVKCRESPYSPGVRDPAWLEWSGLG